MAFLNLWLFLPRRVIFVVPVWKKLQRVLLHFRSKSVFVFECNTDSKIHSELEVFPSIAVIWKHTQKTVQGKERVSPLVTQVSVGELISLKKGRVLGPMSYHLVSSDRHVLNQPLGSNTRYADGDKSPMNNKELMLTCRAIRPALLHQDKPWCLSAYSGRWKCLKPQTRHP